MKQTISNLDVYRINDKIKIIERDPNRVAFTDSRVIIRNKDTKKIIYIGKNKSMLSASEFFAMRAFNLEDDARGGFITPTYNSYLSLDNSISGQTVDKTLRYKINLFCMGRSGCAKGSLIKLETSKQQWIAPNDLDIIPFRYCDLNNDLSETDRQIYFGRKTIGNKIAYYFKRLDAQPTIKKCLEDGNDWTASIYSENTARAAQVYVRNVMTINSTDGKDYFIATTGLNDARFNCVSLCFSWTESSDGMTYHHDIRAATRINFSNKSLAESSSYEVLYDIYF